jgi:ABC-type Na+ efflux pump permease subunit
MRAIIAKDLIAVRRSKAVIIPMLAVPTLLMVVLPLAVGLAARAQENPDVGRILSSMPGDLADPILSLPAREQLIVLVNGYLLAPLFLIVPLMVSAVLAADAFAGEKERKTLESLLHLPIAERDLFIAKLLTAFIPPSRCPGSASSRSASSQTPWRGRCCTASSCPPSSGW